MSVSGYLISFISLLLNILSLAIFVRIIMSWVDQSGEMRVTKILRDLTEPILAPIRSVIPSVSMFDFSPMIAMLLLQALGQIVVVALR